MKKNCVFYLIILLFVFISFSCSRSLGYSVVLWSIPEAEISDGDIVHVLIKSNISQVYVIEKDKKKKEVPFWALSEPTSKSKAKEALLNFTEYQHKYALVALDGLPMREKPVNTAKQVYRLRNQEKIRVLYKGEGQAVMSGKKPLPGDWLRVMTSDGTEGWCFSYNLRIYDETDGIDSIKEVEKQDLVLKSLLEKRWWPESFKTMINNKKIDLNLLNPIYGFVTGSVTGQIRLELPGISVKYPYEGVTTKSSGSYSFDKTPISVTVRNEDFIVLQYINEKGAPQAFNLITLDEDIDINKIIEKEKERRNNLWEELRYASKIYSSTNYGLLQLVENQKFVWSGYHLLTPDFIPANAGSEGVADFKYYLSKSLAEQYDGVITFKFDNSSDDINFFYKQESNGLRLESAKGATFRGNTINARSSSPMVMFFEKN